MLKHTAFVGYGTVGKACHKAFEHNTSPLIIDPKYSSMTIRDIPNFECELAFVSVPAPTLSDNSVDAWAIHDIFQQFVDINYSGLLVLKSTLPPAIVYDIYVRFGHDPKIEKSTGLRYVYSPEFIREKHWEYDAVNASFIIMAGHSDDCKALVDMYKRHSAIPSYCSFKITDYKSAALAKYAINSYLATKVVFMNQMYQLHVDIFGHESLPDDRWTEFISLISADVRIGPSHMQVPGSDDQFGYGGSCFPKDIKALIGFDKSHRLSVIREVSEANTAIRLTGAGTSCKIEG